MPKQYFAQKDNYSCGPIALMNVLSWAGYYVSKNSLSAYQNMCNCVKDIGTGDQDFDKALKFFEKYKVKGPIRTKSTYVIDKALAQKQICVLAFHIRVHGQKSGHFTVLLRKKGFRYITLNNKEKNVFGSISRKELNLYLARRKTYDETLVWYIKKNIP